MEEMERELRREIRDKGGSNESKGYEEGERKDIERGFRSKSNLDSSRVIRRME